MTETIKAVGLTSGGLDSTLALKLIQAQGIEVQAVNFYTGFCIVEQRRRVGGRRQDANPPRNEALRAGADLGVPVELIDISEEYLEMVTKPRFGYGANVNPCLDCRMYMVRRAREYMEEIGAHFLFTGEVLGQRPMSQHYKALKLVAREGGAADILLRPLSAKLLPMTLPEREGWVDRERLCAIQGRSRRVQMQLARELGIEDYPQPAGGCCFLTDESYARRFRDLFAHREERFLLPEEVILLRVGRHFRLSESLKVIVARDEGECSLLERYCEGRWSCQAVSFTGPLVVAEKAGGDLSEEEMLQVAAVTARYGKGRREERVDAVLEHDGKRVRVSAPPADDDWLEKQRI